MSDTDMLRRDYGEWVFGLAQAAAAKSPDVPLDTIWRLSCRAVDVVRPDLDRNADIRCLWSEVVEWIYPRLKRVGADHV